MATTDNSNGGRRIVFCISEYPQNESFILVNYFTERWHIQVRSELRYGINPYTKLLANQSESLHKSHADRAPLALAFFEST
jgi:hypothetical protein